MAKIKPASIAAATICLGLALPATLGAETGTKPKGTPQVDGQTSPPGLVWSLKDSDSTVYLAGSVHLLREKDMPIPAPYTLAYEAADEVFFEVDMAQMFDPANATKMQQLSMLAEGETLAEQLGEETHQTLLDYFSGRGIPAGSFERVKPSMVYLTIAQIEAARQGARPELGLEAQFYLRSKQDGKASSGLETVEYQLGQFDKIPLDSVRQLIARSIEEADAMGEELDKMITTWRTGDGEGLGTLVNEKMGEIEGVREALLVERNQNWVPAIIEALGKDTDVLFIVGAGHLVGDGSVIELLSEKGFEAERYSGE
ncbi:MAG: TraB/GumN family protein [Verrucomicrobiota bacterium]